MQLVECIGVCGTGLHGDERTVGAAFDVAFPRLVFEESVGHDGFAGRSGEHVVAQADDAARGNREFEVYAVALRIHREQVAFTTGYHVDHFAGILFGHVDGELFYRLAFHTVDFLDDNLRLAHLQLVAFATHRLDEDGEVQHTASIDCPYTIFGGFYDAQGKVTFQLFFEAFGNVA